MHKRGIEMSYILSVFTSRNETLYFFNMLRKNNIYADIINTPHELGNACGISVRFGVNNLQLARTLLYSKPFRSFYGFFKITNINQKNIFEKV